ncbi:hypothetical protein ACQEUU_15990 [Nonomuraea sp. CA-218870]|uniref:hypothetical protein n=1 Tax=Nonomuraea sp. CA-218870 TaxID=3239998 RepID=UPI003D8ACC37
MELHQGRADPAVLLTLGHGRAAAAGHPQTPPSGAFHGMVVRALLGDGPTGLTLEHPLTPHQVIITGERAGDASEHEYLAQTGLRRYGVDDLERGSGPAALPEGQEAMEPLVLIQPSRVAEARPESTAWVARA